MKDLEDEKKEFINDLLKSPYDIRDNLEIAWEK